MQRAHPFAFSQMTIQYLLLPYNSDEKIYNTYHTMLTVEDLLWFSAKYIFPSLSFIAFIVHKSDKVLQEKFL